MTKTNKHNGVKEEKQYIENAMGRIIAFMSGACIGSNLAGLEGKEWDYDMGERARDIITKEVMKLYKYGKKTK